MRALASPNNMRPQQGLALAGVRRLVPRVRFELTRPFERHPLKMVCLPVPPPRHIHSDYLLFGGKVLITSTTAAQR